MTPALDGQVITQEGDTIEGREAIEQGFNEIFDETPQTQMEVTVDSIKFIGSDIALEVGSTKDTPAPGETPEHGRYTVLHVKRDGKWLMAAARDTEGDPPTNQERLLLWAATEAFGGRGGGGRGGGGRGGGGSPGGGGVSRGGGGASRPSAGRTPSFSQPSVSRPSGGARPGGGSRPNPAALITTHGIQNFLDVDPHFGMRMEFRDFVEAAHEQGIYVILDIIAHHAGNVFTYAPDRYPIHNSTSGRVYNDPRWDGKH